MNIRPFVFASLLPALLLTGCDTLAGGQKEQAGAVIGAVAGGVIGHQIGGGSGRTAATVLGALAGGYVGHAIGRNMDDTDRIKAANALEISPTGQASTWRNPDTGAQYTVVPNRSWQTAQGPCREYTVDSVVAGRAEKVYGTACRQGDGSWRVQE